MREDLQRAGVGKRLPDATYVHKSCLPLLHREVRAAIADALDIARIDETSFDVIKIGVDGGTIAFLAYPSFFEQPFPALARSWTISTASGRCVKRAYPAESNPPVLHRKELLLPPDHPRRAEFESLTRSVEQAGLFDDPGSIGRLLQWEETLRSKGLRLEGHRLARIAPDETDGAASGETVQRHRTALRRNSLSSPVQALVRYGFISDGASLFDYGCGRGDDVAELQARGIDARGWDPHFAPSEPRAPADLVNLGFVLNVIENTEERREALLGAFALARKVLSVAVLIGGRTAYERFRLFNDGVLTARGTFQKYYTQQELRDYLADTLDREPIAVAPGVFFVFRDDSDEQAFLADRQRLARQWSFVSPLHSKPREQPTRLPKVRRATKWEAHRELLDRFWERCVELGRVPEDEELDGFSELQVFGRPATVLRKLVEERATDTLERSRQGRRDDILVYLALNLFEKRKSLATLPQRLQRDLKAFFGGYGIALGEAKAALFSVGQPDVIRKACSEAADTGLGYLDDDGNLQLHSSLVPRLPAVLRIYIGCASRLYGGIENADVVKIHTESGKLTLMLYDDFDAKALPELIERVKIDMRRQDIWFYEYGAPPFERQLLYLKSRCMSEDMPGYVDQKQVDDQLRAVEGLNFAGYGPPMQHFLDVLAVHGLLVKGGKLVEGGPPASKGAHEGPQ